MTRGRLHRGRSRSIRLSIRRSAAAAFVLLLASLAPAAAIAGETRPRNHLAGEPSPYLQLHVYNPVDWYPFGEEAFEKARREGKPIFLSIGYSTCYWCHVMEREVFSNAQIAAQMNAGFVNVKVDREERPDVDEVYMQATQLLTGSGGWPNSLFLTPDGEPFLAGTYFPPQDEPGRPGFPSVLEAVEHRWQSEPGELRALASRVASAVRASFEDAPAPVSLDPGGLLARAVAALEARYEPGHGGFSTPTKFPSPPRLELLLVAHRRGVPGRASEMLLRTLDEMALGGIHDQLGGGFHRYATEPGWSLPHFEKMLYDNAQLLGVYARAFRATGDPLYRRVAEGIAAHLAEEMTSPEGGLYTAIDAEVAGVEGAGYVWTASEIESVLGAGSDSLRSFHALYELTPLRGTEPEGGERAGVLRIRASFADPSARADLLARLDAAEPSRALLRAARARRPLPLRDEKILAAWNGLAIRGLADAGVELERPDYVERAARAAAFALARLRDPDGRLHRSFVAGSRREDATLDDYAFLADGLVALHAATGDPRWLAAARGLADRMLAELSAPENAGFYLTGAAPAAGGAALFARPRVLADGEMPAGNAVAMRLLRDLGMLTGDARYAIASRQTRAALSGVLEQTPDASGTAVAALASGPQLPAPPPSQPSRPPASTPVPLDRLPTGRDFVRAEVARAPGALSELRVLLEISEGWHVNANPASLDFLIPTRVESIAPAPRIEVVYPSGSAYHPRFSLEPLSVYERAVEIRVRAADPGARLPSGAQLALTFQACDASTCLPPETLPLTIP